MTATCIRCGAEFRTMLFLIPGEDRPEADRLCDPCLAEWADALQVAHAVFLRSGRARARGPGDGSPRQPTAARGGDSPGGDT